jgi:hypothetical protein
MSTYFKYAGGLGRAILVASFAVCGFAQVRFAGDWYGDACFINDSSFTSFTSACRAAETAGKYLKLTKEWPSLASQACAANLVFGGGLLQPSFGGVLTLSGSVEAGVGHIFDSSAGGTIKLTGKIVQAYPQWWGPDLSIDTQLNQAIAALAPFGGKIVIPNGTYSFSTPINADDSRGITIEGSAVPTGGSQSAVYMIWTASGNTTAISARSSASFTMRGLQIIANNPSWSGRWVDLGHSSTESDSFNSRITQCGFFAVNGGSASIGIDLSKANLANIEHNNISGKFDVGIRGVENAADYSNEVVIRENHFSSSTGLSTSSHILNPGQAWLIESNIFEMGNAAGGKRAIDCNNAGTATRGVTVSTNWTGDWSPGSSGGVLIRACGTGWSISGNQLVGPAGGNVLELADGMNGVSVTGNSFVVAPGATSFVFGSRVDNFNAFSNAYSDSASFMRGSPASGTIADARGAIAVYGPSAGLSTTLVVKGKSGANCNLTLVNGRIASTTCP